MLGKTWDPLRHKIHEKLPFIPMESEVDALINSCGKKMACFLQGLKDTGADPGELARLEWTNINYNAKSVTIRHPVKGHSSRVVRVSDLFLRRLSAMPKKGSRIFYSYRGLWKRLQLINEVTVPMRFQQLHVTVLRCCTQRVSPHLFTPCSSVTSKRVSRHNTSTVIAYHRLTR